MRRSGNRVLFTLAVAGCAAALLSSPALAQKGKPKPPPPPPPIVYSLTVLNGTTSANKWIDLNDRGDVVGTMGPSTSRVPVIWPAGSIDPIDLNSFVDPTLGVTLVVASAINDSGQIAGFFMGGVAPFGSYRLSFPEGDPPIFEDMEGGGSRRAINEAGDVVIADGVRTYIFTDETGSFEVENTIFPGNDIMGLAINDFGEVVGLLESPGGDRAFRYSIGTSTMVNLNPPGSTRSVAQDINDAGDIVGSHVTSSSADSQACVWSLSAGFVSLGTLGGTSSTAFGVNNDGLVVGESTAYKPGRRDPPAPSVAFLYINGKMHRVLAEVANGGLIANGQLPASWDQLPSVAFKINDADQICGWVSYPNGTYQRYVLTPTAP